MKTKQSKNQYTRRKALDLILRSFCASATGTIAVYASGCGRNREIGIIYKLEGNDYCSLSPAWSIEDQTQNSYTLVKRKPNGEVIKTIEFDKEKMLRTYGSDKLRETKSILDTIFFPDL